MEQINIQLNRLVEFMTSAGLWLKVGGVGLRILLILILAFIIIRIGRQVINRVFRNRKRGIHIFSKRREETLKILTNNVLTYTVYFIAIVMILESLSLPVGSLLAGAGVAGIAIGFGAQNLVKDIVSGFFIIFEDQFSVGDYVVVSEAEGEVEEIGLRTTKIKSWTGEQHVIANGNITQVINYSVHNGMAFVDVNIPYENDIALAEQLIEDIVKDLPQTDDCFVDTPTVHGVQMLDVSHFVIRVIAETEPTSQWYGARLIRRTIKDRLYNEGIDIPAPRLVMYSRNDQLAERSK
ncbi:MAG TPA: mechanosensitive ion channel family protein [Bacillota bacterium]|nr:mechanosensitive ion channel family protein [Bacillota bacterium]